MIRESAIALGKSKRGLPEPAELVNQIIDTVMRYITPHCATVYIILDFGRAAHDFEENGSIFQKGGLYGVRNNDYAGQRR